MLVKYRFRIALSAGSNSSTKYSTKAIVSAPSGGPVPWWCEPDRSPGTGRRAAVAGGRRRFAPAIDPSRSGGRRHRIWPVPGTFEPVPQPLHGCPRAVVCVDAGPVCPGGEALGGDAHHAEDGEVGGLPAAGPAQWAALIDSASVSTASSLPSTTNIATRINSAPTPPRTDSRSFKTTAAVRAPKTGSRARMTAVREGPIIVCAQIWRK